MPAALKEVTTKGNIIEISVSSGFYAKHIKRIIDFLLSFCALVVLSPLLVILSLVGVVAMGGNPFFTQLRPGKNEEIFKLVKFRSMNNKKDENGRLLPDDARLNRYGKFLRSTSLDELPELINILKGDMAIIGPRPLLVRDMVFMTDSQRMRHKVRPGLSGLAQVNGRNAIDWKNKLDFDISYIQNITFSGDFKLILETLLKVFKRADITAQGMETAEDLGDYLLEKGLVDKAIYDEKQSAALELLKV